MKKRNACTDVLLQDPTDTISMEIELHLERLLDFLLYAIFWFLFTFN